MKRFLVLAASSLVSVVPFVACDDTSSGGGSDAGFTFDASFQAPDVGPVPEAASPDAPVDVPATVLVLKDGAPVAGVNVVFGSADGTLVGTGVTDATGKASGKGELVTVLLGAAGTRQLLTYVGVKPGDVLKVFQRSTRDVQVTLATNNAPNGTALVAAGNLACSLGGATIANPAMLALRPECISGATFPVLATIDYMGGQYWSFKKGNAPAASGTTNVTGLSDWALGSTFTLNLANAANLPDPLVDVGVIAEGQSFATTQKSLALVANGGSTTYSVPPGYADAYQTEAHFRTFLGGGLTGVQSIAKRAPAAGGLSGTVDITALGGLLPSITAATIDSMTSVRPGVSWMSSATFAGVADSGIVNLPFTIPQDGGALEFVDWTFIVPPSATSVKAPQLPAQLADFQPTAASSFGPASIAFFESSLVADYDFVRANAAAIGLARVPVTALQVALPALPADGTLRVSTLYLND